MVKIPWCILTCVTAQLVVGLKGFGKEQDYIWSERSVEVLLQCFFFYSFAVLVGDSDPA